MKICLEFEPRDVWIGAYWRSSLTQYHIWVCLLPCLPIHLSWERAL